MKEYQETQFFQTTDPSRQRTIVARCEADPEYKEAFTKVANMLSDPPELEWDSSLIDAFQRFHQEAPGAPAPEGADDAPPAPDAAPEGSEEVEIETADEIEAPAPAAQTPEPRDPRQAANDLLDDE